MDLNTGQDMCVNSSYIRVIISMIPATVRFLQCLRRYRDTRRWHPHLGNIYILYLLNLFIFSKCRKIRNNFPCRHQQFIK